MSRKHQDSNDALPVSVGSHLSYGRIERLTLDGPDLLRTSLVLGSRHKKPAQLQRMTLRGFRGLFCPNDSLFGPLRPRQLVYHFAAHDGPWWGFQLPIRSHPRLRANHIVVVVQTLALPDPFFGVANATELCMLYFGQTHGVHLASRIPRHPTSVRYVLLPSACQDRQTLVDFLPTRRRAGMLDPAWFQSRAASVIVEVPTEQAKGWVEAGKVSLQPDARQLVDVQIGREGTWTQQ